MSSDYPSMACVGIPTTGDPAEDQRQLEEYLVSEKRQIEGICPNGCGPMMLDDPYQRHCPVCNFCGHSNVPFSHTPENVRKYEVGQKVCLWDPLMQAEQWGEVESVYPYEFTVHWYGAVNSCGGSHYCAKFDPKTLLNRYAESRWQLFWCPEPLQP